jgi:hypothetical protein
MTLCAGLCSFDGCFVSVRLSTPLLKLRPRSDLVISRNPVFIFKVNTLLHEMIHGMPPSPSFGSL